MDANGYLIALSEGDRTDFGRIAFADQPEAQKVFSAVWQVEQEVNNGGFDQYLRNSEADIVAHAPAALRAIGARACARVVASALRVLSPLPPTRAERGAALDALGEGGQARLESADAKFYEYPDDLTALLLAYVAGHPAEFGPVPT